MFKFTTREISDSVTVVEVQGTLNEANRKKFSDSLGEMIESGCENIIINCHQLGYLNSDALATLLTARRHAAKRGGRIYLTNLSSNIAEVLEITKLGKMLSVYPTTEAAMERIRCRPPAATTGFG